MVPAASISAADNRVATTATTATTAWVEVKVLLGIVIVVVSNSDGTAQQQLDSNEPRPVNRGDGNAAPVGRCRILSGPETDVWSSRIPQRNRLPAQARRIQQVGIQPH